ncbi:MAG: MMPL family transporter, partial [Planctomycetes bacterium]|nr:MMPL family transporter [Planctomycetota bacterium]
FCVALGLMVDDTIHLAARYDEERRHGLSPRDAVLCALRTAGRPVVVTTLVLLVGFVTILGSGFKGTFTFGLLVDLSLSFALVAALVLLPALLRALAPGKTT